MFSLRALVVRLILVMVLTKAMEARTLRWFCDAQTVNLGSDGTPMDGGFRFEVGVFASGFTPTTANTSQWAANWSAAQRTVYNATTKVFTSQYTVTSNAAPFTVGAVAYVWGFGGRAGNEWTLFRATSWTWPLSDTLNPTAISWNAKDATQVVVGSIHSTGTPFLMQSSAVTHSVPPTSTYAQWQNEELSGVALNGPEEDADGDGIKNVQEFVFGTRPKVADLLPPVASGMVGSGADRAIQLSIPRRLDRSASLSVESSPELVTWGSAMAGATVVSNGAEAWVLRFPVGSSDRRFFRIVSAPVP
ncbi:hypothetical protein [Luteolibacter soli]|uniref:Uncharacterized protein n=1 Tax=Luteolibacter soli TaxID=3135280 RepID=A0ABU9AY43_9BACT